MIDVVIFAVIAAVLVFKLWSQLGKRGDGESGFDTFVGGLGADNGKAAAERAERAKNDNKVATEKAIDADFSDVPPKQEIPDYSAYGNAAKGLQTIKAAAPYFDPQEFLKGAEAAFEMILQDFTDGNKKSLKSLLGADLYKSFADAIDERTAKGEKISDTLIGVDKVSITDARLSKDIACVTVSIHSQQVIARYDEKDELIEGDEHKTIPKIDIWVFERKVKSKDPNWILMATDS